jgi:FkbM family methyltransferase
MTIGGRFTGHALRLAGPVGFRGKGRIVRYWMEQRDTTYVGLRRLRGGATVTCDFSVPYEAMIWIRQEEEIELRRLAAKLRPGDHFVDCGAGIGLWTLTAAARVGDAGIVSAFEPNPAAHHRLLANLAASPVLLPRVHPFPLAVGDRTGGVFIESSAPYNVARIVDRAGGTVPVEMVTLDTHLPPDQPVHGLKIDVEGCEHRVLTGARRLVERWRPWIWAELNVEITGATCLAEWPVYQFLRERGYRCSWPAADRRLTGYVNCLFEPA